MINAIFTLLDLKAMSLYIDTAAADHHELLAMCPSGAPTCRAARTIAFGCFIVNRAVQGQPQSER